MVVEDRRQTARAAGATKIVKLSVWGAAGSGGASVSGAAMLALAAFVGSAGLGARQSWGASAIVFGQLPKRARR